MQISVVLYGIVGLIGVLSDIQTSLLAVGLQGAAFAVLGLLGVLIQVFVKKYRSCLTKKVEDKSDIIKFAFTFGALAQRHLANYRGKRQEAAANSEVVSRVPNNSQTSLHPVNSDSIVLAL